MKTPYGWNVCLPWEGNPADLWQSQQALELLAPDGGAAYFKWMDYWCEEPIKFPGYVPTVRSKHLAADPVPPAVTRRLAAHPAGETWLLFNEGHLREQDDCTPAEAVKLALKFINLADSARSFMNYCGPNAAINMAAQHAAGMTGKAWHREYLRISRAKGIGEPSIIGLHTYHGTDVGMVQRVWSEIVETWRWQWLGKCKPVVITEACAENEAPDIQMAVMDEYFRLLQIGRHEGPAGQNGAMGVFWFISHGRFGWPNCVLTEIDPTKTQTMRLTPMGRHWKELQARLA